MDNKKIKKNGRPTANNVEYFPHKCKDDKELVYILYIYKTEGYVVFYRIQQYLGDVDYHRVDLKNNVERKMFEMFMLVDKKIVYEVIDILVEMGWLDKELYEKENILWSDKFVKSIRAVYINRKKRIPTKDVIHPISTSRNRSIVEYSKEKDSKVKKSKESIDDISLYYSELKDKFPDLKDVKKSLNKYLSYTKNPTIEGATRWLKNEKDLKQPEFKKSATGDYIAYCSKCGGQEFPRDNFAIRNGSSCCHVEYQVERLRSNKKNDKGREV